MELKMFNYINEATEILKNKNIELEAASNYLVTYFKEILSSKKEDYSNIVSRVKSSYSLKEKIIRNSYYKKYSIQELFDNLSDLIGIRIECKFIENENDIYKVFKKFFNKIDSNGLYHNSINSTVKMKLSGKQPQEQKNGFKIFRIDGIYYYNETHINFELQIKSLVNMFWGEIEHQIIYKNYNYMPLNNILVDIMASIKNSLTMMDNQLSMLSNQINQSNNFDTSTRMLQTEMIISKLVFDIYSSRMRENIGFIVDFKSSCDIIMKYIFRSNNAKNLDDYNNTMLKTFVRLNDISKNPLNFDVEIYFEDTPYFEDEFSNIVGNTILKAINSDFQWNLLLRMLFEIELGNNTEDFQTFIKFLRNRFSENPAFSKLYADPNLKFANEIIESFINIIAQCFSKVVSIHFLYDYNLNAINYIVEEFIEKIFEDQNDYITWNDFKSIYLGIFRIKILSIFDYDIETSAVNDLLERLKNTPCKFDISKRVIKYEDKPTDQTKIKSEEAVKLFKMK